MLNKIISIEKVLNSRCSYSFDRQKEGKWGIFKKEKPEKKNVNKIIESCKVPQHSGGELLIWFEGDYLYLGFKKTNDPLKEKIMHVESGMQQEAVYLACTAIGVGTCIHNLGINGTDYGDKIATVRHFIMNAEGPYEGNKFSTNPPGPESPFIKGRHFSEPKRDSEIECLPELNQLTLTRKQGSSANEKEVSQILWSARGRTPHYVKGNPWGLTVPTWGGGQKYTGVYLLKKGKLFSYINWKKFLPFFTGNPTHDIKLIKKINNLPDMKGYSNGIILTKKENTSMALWEIGYMLENMLLQAKGLGISFKTIFLRNNDSVNLSNIGISNAVVMLLL